jgi:selenocysteine lyase/cysteine desulfurase
VPPPGERWNWPNSGPPALPTKRIGARSHRIRVSTHFFNTPQEVERLLAGVTYLAEHATQFAGKEAL